MCRPYSAASSRSGLSLAAVQISALTVCNPLHHAIVGLHTISGPRASSIPSPCSPVPWLTVLQVIIQKLSASERTKAGAVQYADQMMALFLRVFACRSATVHEEAMMAIGALAYATGE